MTYGNFTEKIFGNTPKKSDFLRENMKFDAPYLTDLGEKYVEGGNNQIFELSTKGKNSFYEY